MKGKLYSQLEFLTAEQAVSYLCYLINVSGTGAVDILVDYANQNILEFYCLFPSNSFITLLDRASTEYDTTEQSSFFSPIKYQSHSRGLILKKGKSEIFAYIKSIFEVVEFEGVGTAHYLDGSVKMVYPAKTWVTDGYLLLGGEGSFRENRKQAAKSGFILSVKVYFSKNDVDSLAAQINREPDTQALHKEIEALKAEVERLQTENNELKTSASVSGEISPREKDSLYKIITAMAVDGYGHNLEARRNTTTKELEGALAKLGIPLAERTIRNHLSAAIDILPAKLIKT
ncbi:hypothetical protein ACBP46_10780 [Paenalcaligenes hominis]|uniref:hypothetical protein n=1 Tax=Paenalcaligenes hominis TaxID=643674 RepID=UPI00352368B2